MADLALITFGSAVGVIVYTYVGYPLILAGFAWLRPRRIAAVEPGEWPLVTVLIPAYNEAQVISAKLENVLQLDYPRSRMQILVVSDASTDETDSIVQRYADRGVELLRVSQRGGKTAAQAMAASRIRGEYVVNTDASVVLDAKAVKNVIKRFLADDKVALVSGRVVGVEKGSEESKGESWYLGYEMTIRLLESWTGSTVGATGALYAVRRELFGDYPAHLCRDFGTCLLARKRGLRAVVEPTAKSYVSTSNSLGSEYRRKVRTMTNGMQTLFYHASLLNPFQYGFYSLKLISHKLARYLTPLWLLGALLSAIWLAARLPVGARVVLLSVVAMGSLAVAAAGMRRLKKGLLGGLAYLAVANLALVAAWRNVLTGVSAATWDPTRRKSAGLSS